MKKFIVLLSFLFLVKLVVAAELSIHLIQYDAESNIARIQISNLGDITYRNVSISIDNGPFKFIVGKMGPKAAFITTKTLTPEKHTITISTNEKIFSKELSFAKSQEDVEEELKKIEEERAKIPPAPKPKRKKPLLSRTAKQVMFIIVILAVIFLVILFIKKSRKQKTIPKTAPKQIQRPVFRQQSRFMQRRIMPHRPIFKRMQQKQPLKPTFYPKKQEKIEPVKQEEDVFNKLASVKKEAPSKEPTTPNQDIFKKLGTVSGKEKKGKKDVFHLLSKIKK